MHIALRTWLIRCAAGAAALVFILALTLSYLIWTASGVRVLADFAGWMTGGEVTIVGIEGDSVHHLRAASVELRDKKGVWLRVENLVLDWDAFSALGDKIEIEKASAARIVMFRRPLPKDEEASNSSTGVKIAALQVGEIALLEQRTRLAAQGSLDYVSRHDVTVDLHLKGLNRAIRYDIAASITKDVVRGGADINEGDAAIIGPLLGLTGLGPLHLTARADAEGSANRVALLFTAGPLRGQARGTLDLAKRRAALSFATESQALKLLPGLSWNSFRLSGQVSGSFDKPNISATLRSNDVAYTTLKALALSANVKAAGGLVAIEGEVVGLVVPGDAPNAFSAVPVKISAKLRLDAPSQPVNFILSHPHLSLHGSMPTEGDVALDAYADVSDLGAVAAIGGVELGGKAHLRLQYAQTAGGIEKIAVEGRLAGTGASALGRLLGQASIKIDASLKTDDILALNGRVEGAAIAAQVNGGGAASPDFRWTLQLSDISRLTPAVTGNLKLDGNLRGKDKDARLTMAGRGAVGTRGFRPENITFGLQLGGFPSPDTGHLSLSGRFANAPLSLKADLGGTQALAKLDIHDGAWKSVTLDGHLLLARKTNDLRGKLALKASRLADLSPLTGEAMDGVLQAMIDIGAGNLAHVDVDAKALRYGDTRIARFALAGNISDLLGNPSLRLKLSASGIAMPDGLGESQMQIDGPLWALSLKGGAKLPLRGANLALALDALADIPKKTVRVQSLSGGWKDQPLRLMQAATIDYAKGFSVSGLDARFGEARLSASGRITPELALDLKLANLQPEQIRLFLPDIPVDGVMSGQARLTGTLAEPYGIVELHGRDLRLQGMSRSVKPATLDATATLRGKTAGIDALLVSDQSLRLSAKGDIPLNTEGSARVRLSGRGDLAILSGFLAATGQSLRGTLVVDGMFTGNQNRPRFAGGITLSGGELRDYARGLRLRDIDAAMTAEGSLLRVTRLTAKAGPGTVTGSGTVDLAADGMPLALTLSARNARPVESDRFTANLNADVVLKGRLEDSVDLVGSVRILQSEINLPEKLPPNVARLDVRRKGDEPPSPSTESKINFDLQVVVPGLLYVRGRGLEAEMSGDLKIAGTADEPRVLGAFNMRRGTLAVAGRTLTFKSGKVSFDGDSLRSRLDPALEFIAETSSGGVVATLTLTGYASAPRIELSSVPSLPQDEILSRLLFQQGIKQLSALQLAELAQAAASLAGLGSDFNPVASLRKSLGLDRLAIGSTQGTNGQSGSTTIEAGRYIGRNLYVGGRQTLSGGTRAIVQYDLTERLKLEATVNAGTSSVTTPSTRREDQGSSVGVTYQFDY